MIDTFQITFFQPTAKTYVLCWRTISCLMSPPAPTVFLFINLPITSSGKIARIYPLLFLRFVKLFFVFLFNHFLPQKQFPLYLFFPNSCSPDIRINDISCESTFKYHFQPQWLCISHSNYNEQLLTYVLSSLLITAHSFSQ